MFEDNEKNIQEVLMKYAKDMSAMCNMIANILRTLISEEKVQNLDSEDKYAKMLCLIHKAFLESTDIGKQARNGNPNASKSLSGIVNNIAIQSGFINDKSELRFIHTEVDEDTFQSSLEIRRRIKEDDEQDKVDIDKMIKNAGLKKGGAEA
tara:strand:- start:358 stop:810 length:453 start_codon:yes stop_codon:yes gene_type:complete